MNVLSGNLTRKTPASAVKIFVQDQMIIFMALADGESRLLCGPLTLHTETAIHIAEKMTGAKFKVGCRGSQKLKGEVRRFFFIGSKFLSAQN